MRRARLAVPGVVVLLVALLAPGTALADGPMTVTGTVVRDGTPVTGVGVVVSVTGSDAVVTATTDEDGAFTLGVEAAIGSELRVDATGQTSRSRADRRGCVHTETPVGSVRAVIDADPPAPLTVSLDQVLTGTFCPATAAPAITPPATDAVRQDRTGSPTGTLALVLGLLVAVGGVSLVVTRRRA